MANRPAGFWRALVWARRFRLPILIAENGIEDEADRLRPRYLAAHIRQLWRAVNFNWNVRGYLHWTLVDSFEWERGWTQRFGLWGLDPATQERRRRSSADLYAEICKANGLSSEMVAQHAPEALEVSSHAPGAATSLSSLRPEGTTAWLASFAHCWPWARPPWPCLRRAWGNGTYGRTRRTQRPFGLPLQGPPSPSTWLLGQPYGNTEFAYRTRYSFYAAGQGLHFGIDLSARCGTEVVAIGDGIVSEVDNLYHGAEPHNLMIDHPNGYASFYGHLLERPVLRRGDSVVRGQVIALTGDPDGTCSSPTAPAP